MLKSLPKEVLPNSAFVDFLHLVACGKPAVRVKLHNTDNLAMIKEWCREWHFYLVADADNYISIAHDISLAQLILLVDRSPEPHERILGKLLGYPDCCCESVERIGEVNIDLFASKIISWQFDGCFALINPSRYIDGCSLICHLPCSTQCQASLELAYRALSFIKKYSGEPILNRWVTWLRYELDFL